MCFYKHPFANLGNLGILSARYKFPDSPPLNDNVRLVIEKCLSIDPRDRPSALTLVDFTEAFLVRATAAWQF